MKKIKFENPANLPDDDPKKAAHEQVVPFEASEAVTSPEENTENDPEKINSENMEVHTHGHVHETSKWKEYLFQFIMLFLAITLSFFVENLREHYIEHERAKILAASLVQNLKEDIMETETVVHVSDTVTKTNDVLIAELNKPRSIQNDSIIHVNGLQKILRFNVFDPSSGNYDQVKYSGALRYFKPAIVNQLTSYETDKNYLLKIAQTYLDFRIQTLIPFCQQQTNPKFSYAIINKKPIPKPVFSRPPTAENLDRIFSYALYINSQLKHQILINKLHRKKAEDLIKLLSETYDLK